MAETPLDAFIYFKTDSDSRRVPEGFVGGETSDKLAKMAPDWNESLNPPSQLRSYNFSFAMDANWAQNEDYKGGNDLPHRPTLTPLVITKAFDKLSPTLLTAIHQASVFEYVKLTQRRAGGEGGHQTFMYF